MDIKSISGAPINSFGEGKIGSKNEPSSPEFARILEKKIEDDKKLLEACQMLESFFVKEILKSADQVSFSEDSFIKESNAEKTFKDMLNDEYAQMMSKGKGMGIAEMLFRQMKSK